MATATTLVNRALSLADLVNSKFISYEDEVNSINESYRDIYSWLCNCDDDYFIKQYETTATPNVSDDPNVALITLPTDFYKLRFIDYLYQGYWQKMRKYTPEARNNNPSTPQYRFFGSQLRIIGLNPLGSNGLIRLTYYPPADTITLPDYTYAFGTSYNPYDLPNIGGDPSFTSLDNSLIYIYNGTTIRVESQDLNTISSPITLFTSTGMSYPQYFRGYIYFLKGGEIWRGQTDLASTMTAAAITSSGSTVLEYAVQPNGLIYYVTSTAIRSCTLSGTADSLVQTVAATDPNVFGGTGLVFRNSSTGEIVINGNNTGTLCTDLTTDGIYIFYLDSLGNLYRASWDSTLLTLVDATLLKTDVADVGNYASFRLPLNMTDGSVQVISSIPDYDFTYPLNEVNEIIAYQAAIDFKRKQNADFGQLSQRMAELQRRLLDVLKRDEGLPSKIGNAYNYYDSAWR